MKNQPRAFPRGMNLLELLIGIAIFGIISSITVYNYRIAQRRDDLRQAAIMLSSHIREAQNQAMTGVNVGGGTEIPRGGYGVHVDTDPSTNKQYVLFGDITSYAGTNTCSPQANGRYEQYLAAHCPGCNCPSPGLTDTIIRTVALPRDVTISKIVTKISGTASNVLEADMSFRPPKPLPFVGTGFPQNPSQPHRQAVQGQTAYVVLQHAATGRCRLVSVFGASGQISEQNVTQPVLDQGTNFPIVSGGECGLP